MTCAVVAGIGGYVPPGVVTNEDLTKRFDTSDTWIRTRTGIATRHVVDPGAATSDLAVEAGRRALECAGATTADAVVLATSTPDHLCPATAPAVAARLSLGSVPAFDVGAVCSGFVYGLATAAGLITAGTAETVLLVAADAFTTMVDPRDRSTSVIFADGAGAVLLRAGDSQEAGAVGPVVLGSDGAGKEVLEVPAGGSRQRSSGVPPEPGDEYLKMRGREAYRHAVERMTTASRQALARVGWTPDDVHKLAAHQANARIIGTVAEELGIGQTQRLTNIEQVGNTVGASIPLLLAQAASEGRLVSGERVLLTTFGAGLAWGATTLTWPSLGEVPAPSAA
ncbi:beta-ketoacyl-ACP synthase III [Streptomyces solisilvae]|uniref:beta-ketoacyl-ACP synthase III n=1 Tax=Streptomyces malaysiensis TaxID=92644 RepID=UPI0036CE7A72